MPQISVTELFIIIAMFVVQATAQSVIYPPNCNSVCGVKVRNDSFEGVKNRLHHDYVILDNVTGECVEDAILPIAKWNTSAREFMEYVGMNDDKFGCLIKSLVTISSSQLDYELPRWLVTEQDLSLSSVLVPKRRFEGSNGHVTEPILPTNFSSISGDILYLKEPNNIPGHCTVTSHRGVERRLSENQLITDWVATTVLYDNQTMRTEGTVFSLRGEQSNSLEYIRVPRSSKDDCASNNCTKFSQLWLPASTFNTSVSVTLNEHEKDVRFSRFVPSFSMFARFTFDEIPGVDRILEQLRQGVEEIEDVRDDLSTSNLAILFLPLVMAIPPLSLLEPVSDVAIAWYAFATDVLAALPLLIKGIEMILVYRKATPKMLSALSLDGEKFGLFEMWYIRCNPPPGRVGVAGVIIVFIALWFMVASTYVEFLFWRKMRYKQGHLRRFELIVEQLPDTLIDDTPIVEADSKLKRVLSGSFQGRRKYFVLFSIILTFEFGGLVSRGRPDAIYPQFLYFDVIIVITLAIFREVLVKRLRQFRQWRFWVGLILGLITGPLHLFIHSFESIRNSDRWEVIADGCNLGFGLSVMIIHILLTQIIEILREQFFHSFLFVWVFGFSVILTHVIRSDKCDREFWRFGCHGFVLGLLFGPLGLLFKGCFPECVDHKRVRGNFFSGLVYGVIYISTGLLLLCASRSR